MMDTLLEASAGLLEPVILLAIAAVPLALLVLAVDLSFGRRMTPGWRHAMWLLVAVRLILPFAPESPFSLANLLPEGLSAQASTEPTAPVQYSEAELAEFLHEWESIWFADSVEMQPYRTSGLDLTETRVEASSVDWEEVIVIRLLITWPLGVAWLLGRALLSTWRFSKQVQRSPAVVDGRLMGLLDEACRRVGVWRRPAVRLVEGLPSPALFGLLRPTICLPTDAPEELDEEQLRLILTHEVAHLRRGDAWVAWVVTLVGAIHWWNPVAWLVTRRIETLRELACDEMVRRSADEPAWRRYADLLIRFASARPATRLGLVGLWMARPKRKLAERLGALTAEAAGRWRMPIALAGPLVAGVALVGMTGAVSEANNRAESVAAQSHPNLSDLALRGLIASQYQIDETLVVEEHNVAPAVAKLEAMYPKADACKWLCQFALIGFDTPDESELIDCQIEDDVWRFKASQWRHNMFSDVLAGFAASGSWQVCVQTRFCKISSLRLLGDIDWTTAIRYPEPTTYKPESAGLPVGEGGDHFSINANTQKHAPYLSVVLSDAETRSFLQRFREATDDVAMLSTPKVTLFNGQEAFVSDQSQTPFVTGLNWIRGPYATAAQPQISVLTQGCSATMRPMVIDAESVDLRSRLVRTEILESDTFTFEGPDGDVTVQVPTSTRLTVDAHCWLKRGETLVMAPLTTEPENEGITCCLISADWFEDVPPAKNEE